MSKKIMPVAFMLALSSCNNSGSSPITEDTDEYYVQALQISSDINMTAANLLQSDCLFNGQTLANGQSITAFQNSSAAHEESCQSEIRTCVNGTLTGSYNYSVCEVAVDAACLFNGQSVTSGTSVLAYRSQSVELGAECDSEYRTCDNGLLSGSFQYASCDLTLAASCLFNGQTIASEESVLAYQNSSVPFGESCQMEHRVCQNGQLSGSYNFSSCNAGAAAGCLFNGQTIAHGQNVSAYLSSTGPTCEAEVRTCFNGQLSGSYNFASCEINQPASCLFDGKTIVHGDSIAAYENSSVSYAEMCRAETRTCDNGHLSGSYSFTSCDPGQAAACLFNGQTIAHGQSVQAYFSSSGIHCETELRVCNNGLLLGSYQFASCQAQQAKSCLFKGLTLTHGQTLTAFKKPAANSHEPCESEQRKCHNGQLSGSYTQLSCTDKTCPRQYTKPRYKPEHHSDNRHDYFDGFKDDQRMIKVCHHVARIKQEQKSCDRFNESRGHTSRKYKESYDCGLHLGWYKHKHHHHSCGKRKGWYKEKR
jgi:hypothetical protein